MTVTADNGCLIALGGNLAATLDGNRAVLDRALAALAGRLGAPLAVSGFWRTPAWPPESGPDFVNACAAFAPTLPPQAVLDILHGVEAALGRVRGQRWGARAIDLDLLAQGACVLPDAATLAAWMDLPPAEQGRAAPDRLILPHPRLHQRGFVLLPLAQIAPGWVHPRTGRTVAQMLADLPAGALAGIVALT